MPVQRLPKALAARPSRVPIPHRNTGGVSTRPLQTSAHRLPLVAQRQMIPQPIKYTGFS